MNESQIDMSRLGEVEYMCQLGDAIVDCGIKSFHYNDAGQIIEIEMAEPKDTR